MVQNSLTFDCFLSSLCFIQLSGEVIDSKNRCKKCVGKKVVEETKILEVTQLFPFIHGWNSSNENSFTKYYSVGNLYIYANNEIDVYVRK